MQKEDWVNVARWMGYVSLPIALLLVGIFILTHFH